ncbi:beta-propeller domain-containing protein [Sorangium sp. So ce1153]|uniref:beta-propeller domain-containing protein n=1 Tax=Sorangium sp. So ce1153 TaxID=3133333 RepID=UPI003F5EE0B0
MTFLSRSHASWLVLTAAAVSAWLTGCQVITSTGPSPDETTPTDFISGNPNGPGGRDVNGGADGEGTSAGTGGGAVPDDDGGGDGEAERAITEADIIQVKDGKLYALSQYSGLSIIDISRRDRLRLVGRHQASGIPFEMYLRDGVVYAMFSSWEHYILDDSTGGYTSVQTSRIEALDVSDPANIQPIGSFDLPGSISDSRIVGDVLYAVTFENGYCWGCSSSRNTTVTSLSVADPADIDVVDQLTYGDEDPYGYGWRRSVSVTADRMYVAGIEWDGTAEGHSTIQIIDISDPGGALVEGASVEATGQIESRWQMDEHEGVLRVISQPGLWWNNQAKPGVQTFSVASSEEITPLGYTELTLPRPETLRSVRFDGDRAYAITAEQTDPLFTIDLSDPEHPAQVGELEMPGWVYHMQPRGNRLLALGFDNASTEASLHVSLFDVSDLSNPTMLERVHFGGWGGSFAEDQDRIHKAFTILDDLGTILVPYSGWSYDSDQDGCGSYESGIQLIDFTTDSLTKRGSAPARGQARRAFVHDDRLFAVSDEEVGTFNIDDRDAPVEVADLTLATIVDNAVVTGDLVVRLSTDWWTSSAQVEVVPAADPGRAEPLGKLDLAELSNGAESGCYGSGITDPHIFAHGQYAYLLWVSYSADWTAQVQLAVIDLRNPEAPRVASQGVVPFRGENGLSYLGYYGNVVQKVDSVVQAGSTLVVRNVSSGYYYYDDEGGGAGAPPPSEASLEIIDLSDPSSPAHRSVALPEGAGYTGLQIDGTTVLTSHWVPLPDDPSRARFYIDRIDVADPSSPVVRAPVNVPGSLLAFDRTSGRALTMDYQTVEFEAADYVACYGTFGWAEFLPHNQETREGPGLCRGTSHTLKLVDVGAETASLRDESPLADNRSMWEVFVGDDRVFMYTYGSYYTADDGDTEDRSGVLVASGLEAGSIELAPQTDSEIRFGWPLLADGKRLLLSSYSPPSLVVLDAADLDELTYETKGELSSYPTRVTVSGDRALCPLGHYGLEVVDIGD